MTTEPLYLWRPEPLRGLSLEELSLEEVSFDEVTFAELSTDDEAPSDLDLSSFFAFEEESP